MAPDYEAVERLVENVSKAYGYGVIPSRKFNAGDNGEVAPMLEQMDEKTILPDVFCTSEEQNIYAEVKSKEKPVPYRKKKGTLQHGIDKINWDAYNEIQEFTKTRVWMFVYEGKSGMLLRQSVTRLDVDHSHTDGGVNMEPMVYFDRDEFVKVPLPRNISIPSTLSPQLDLEEPAEGFNLYPLPGEGDWAPKQIEMGAFND